MTWWQLLAAYWAIGLLLTIALLRWSSTMSDQRKVLQAAPPLGVIVLVSILAWLAPIGTVIRLVGAALKAAVGESPLDRIAIAPEPPENEGVTFQTAEPPSADLEPARWKTSNMQTPSTSWRPRGGKEPN